jgi:hypothetical protein
MALTYFAFNLLECLVYLSLYCNFGENILIKLWDSSTWCCGNLAQGDGVAMQQAPVTSASRTQISASQTKS